VNRSVRFGYYNSDAKDISVRNTTSNASLKNKMRRISSEPCMVASLGQGKSSGDAAVEVSCRTHPTAPVNIGNDITLPQAPKPPPNRSRSGMHSQHVDAVQSDLDVSSAPPPEIFQGTDAFSPHRPTAIKPQNDHTLLITKQGGLSTALSREPSVRHGHHGHQLEGGKESSDMDTRESPCAIIRGRESVTQKSGETDASEPPGSAQPSAIESASQYGPADASNLVAALKALKTNCEEEIFEEKLSETTGVIVVDTSLAMRWSDSAYPAGPSETEGESAATDSGVSPLAPGRSPPSTHGHHPSTASGSISNEISESSNSNTKKNSEWNARFLRRWRAVKHQARLQALGVRSIWKLSSPQNGDHRQPELLINTHPIDFPEKAQSRHGSGASPETLGNDPVNGDGSRGHMPMPRDPSLAALLLGEVAEVC